MAKQAQLVLGATLLATARLRFTGIGIFALWPQLRVGRVLVALGLLGFVGLQLVPRGAKLPFRERVSRLEWLGIVLLLSGAVATSGPVPSWLAVVAITVATIVRLLEDLRQLRARE